MSWMTRYPNPEGQKVRMSPESFCGYRGEYEQLEAAFDEQSIAFKVLNSDESVFAEGRFLGGQGDRDWPLNQCRNFARNMEKPVKLIYDDGLAFVWNDEFDEAAPLEP